MKTWCLSCQRSLIVIVLRPRYTCTPTEVHMYKKQEGKMVNGGKNKGFKWLINRIRADATLCVRPNFCVNKLKNARSYKTFKAQK